MALISVSFNSRDPPNKVPCQLSHNYDPIYCRTGLVHGKSVDGALAWLSEHQDDADIDQPYMVSSSAGNENLRCT